MNSEFRKPGMTVSEAVALSEEMESLLAGATPADRDYLEHEFGQDPSYSTARLGKQALAEVVKLLSSKLSVVSPADEQPTAQSETIADLEELIRDLEGDHEAIAAEATIQRADVEAIHALAAGYADIYPRNMATKKQRGNLSRFIGGSFKEHWTAEQLANDPMRLKNILESLYSMDNVSPAAKQDIEEFIARKVCDYVRDTVREVSIDTLARRLEASTLPGLATDTLQKNLLGCYFAEAAGFSDIPDIIESYEKIVLAIIRLGDKPEAAKDAIAIASFNTPILPENSLFRSKLLMVPMMRVDQPQWFGRAFDSARTLASLGAHFEAMDEIERPKTKVTESLGQFAERFARTGMTANLMRDLSKHHNRTAIIHGGIAQNVLGEEEFQARLGIMEEFIKLCRNPDKFYDILFQDSEADSMVMENFSSMMIYVGRHLREKYPESQDFINGLLDSDYPASQEFADVLGDIATKFAKQFKDGKRAQPFTEALRRKVEEISGETITPEDFTDIIANRTNIVTRLLDDGFAVDYMGPPGAEPSEVDWQRMIGDNADRIESAKAEVRQMKGMTRRAVTIGNPDTLEVFVIRPESELDHKAFHSVDNLLRNADIEEAEDMATYSREENMAVVEECKTLIMLQRRRFLNNRGIIIKDSQDDAVWSMTLNKHPRNPQFFVCTVGLDEGQGVRSARILMNSDLRFELGDKKVRSPIALSEINAIAAMSLMHFMCQDAVETEEGLISDEHNAVTARIAHLRLLPEGQRYSYDAWSECLEAEGLDLEVLSELQQYKYDTARKSTYVKAVEKDDLSLGPIRIYLRENGPNDAEPAEI